ncbi:hypothetical protein F511_32743 [Dorcoceras hygrometricum]|uniref:Uncharacterized protein n=1 Tax=Dorcoceras hygrometricum TaxID=472368 RepID=A0A2Z7D5U9_9LAMI|nr:hypothetical protein F511_32743 [Dorcoceras hygrometricum]
MSDRVSCWYFRLCVLVGSSSNADVDFKYWYFSCDGQQRALSDSEATMFCEQEPAVGFASVFLSGYRNYVVLISWNDNVLGVTFSDARASGNTALSSPCWDLLAICAEWLTTTVHGLGNGFPGYSAGRGVGPTGGAPGGA